MEHTYYNVIKLHEAYRNITVHYGWSKFYNYIPVLVLISDCNYNSFGDFYAEEEQIIINLCGASFREVIETMIHEYQHYLQHPGWYTRYEKKYGYDKNPYEIQANEIAKRDWKLF